jgi:PRTRC genetic system protein E
MLFASLEPMLTEPQASLLMTLTRAPSGRLCLTVLPQMPEGSAACEALSTGLSLQGTAAELDAGVADALTAYVKPHMSLHEQALASVAVLAAAKTELSSKVAKAANKSATAPAAKATALKRPSSVAEVPSGSQAEDDDLNDDEGESTKPSTASTDTVSLF